MFKKSVSILLLLLSVFSVIFPTSANAAKRTSTVYSKSSGSGGVAVYPYLSGDKKTLYMDFESSNFGGVEYIKYNLNYDTNNEGTIRGLEGTIVPDSKENIQRFGGIPYIRRKLITGYCSGVTCVYWAFPRNFKITVTTKLKNVRAEKTEVYKIEY